MEEVVELLEPLYHSLELQYLPGLCYSSVVAPYFGAAVAKAEVASGESLEEIKYELEGRREELEEDIETYGVWGTDLKERLLHPRRSFKAVGYRIGLERQGELEEEHKSPVRSDILEEQFS